MATISRHEQEDSHYLLKVVEHVKRSFLLLFVTFGLTLLLIVAPLLSYLGNQAQTETAAGIIGASGMVLVVVNLVGYLIFRFLRKRY